MKPDPRWEEYPNIGAACCVATKFVDTKATAILAPASSLTRRKSLDDAYGGRYGRCSATFNLPPSLAPARFLNITVALHPSQFFVPIAF